MDAQSRGQEGIGRTIARDESQHQSGRDHPTGVAGPVTSSSAETIRSWARPCCQRAWLLITQVEVPNA